MLSIGIHNTGIHSSLFALHNKKFFLEFLKKEFQELSMTNIFQIKLLKFFLNQNKISINELNNIVIAWNPVINIDQKYRPSISEWSSHPAERLYSNANILLPKLKNKELEFTTQKFHYKNKVINFYFLNHHTAHILNAYYCSGFKNSAIFSCDGYGERASTNWSVAKNNQIQKIKEIDFPNSIGQFYSTITQFLGFRPNHDEWKVMSLASYGNKKKFYNKFMKIFKFDNRGHYSLDLNYFDFYNFDNKYYFNKNFEKLFGYPRKKNEKITKRHFDTAAGLQNVIERYVFASLRFLKKETKLENLCLTGGVFMNSVLNGKIYNSKIFKNVFIPFAPDDSGNSIGATIWIEKK